MIKDQLKLRNNKGITLVALIITIVVLLILAFVVLTAMQRNNIIESAKIAKDKTQLESLKENIQLILNKRKIDKEQGSLGELKNDLEKGVSGKKKIEESIDAFYVTRDGATVTVYKDGTMEDKKFDVWDGTSKNVPQVDEQNNWHIYTTAQLKFLADFVNKKLTDEEKGTLTISADTVIYLENSLDLGAREQNGTIANGATVWEPIGNGANKFEGIFDGKNNTIKGVYVNQPSNYAGLFGYSTNIIKDLTIKDSYIEGYSGVGGIVGYSTNLIENCNNQNTIVTSTQGSNKYVGGVVGYATGNIANCANTGTIKGVATGGSHGGVVGMGTADVSNCTNYGLVTGNGKGVGGIGGAIRGAISSCINNNDIVGNNESTGGVVGIAGTTMTGCLNEGSVTGTGAHVGGIAGTLYPSGTISGCINTAAVVGKDENVGGIVGTSNSKTTVVNCMNSGAVTCKSYAGGIAGVLARDSAQETNSTIELCYNSGAITVSGDYVGGIIGEVAGTVGKGTIIKCYNKGMITGLSFKGAIIGNNKGTNTLNNLYYLSSVGIGAINNGQDNTTNKIMATTDDITYEEFNTWINSK